MKYMLKDRWKLYEAKRQEKLRSEFLPEAVEIVEKPASPLGAAVIAVVTAVVLFFVIWAVVGRMDEVVSARGRIVSITGTQTIQAANGGIVRKICVREGEHVEAGQELALLDASVYEITLQNTNHNIEMLEYENELLQRILDGLEIDKDSEENSEKVEIKKYVLSLKAEYDSQREELLSENKKADIQIVRNEDTLDSLRKEQEYLKEQLKILKKAAEGENATERNAEKISLAISQKKAELDDLRILYEAGAIAYAEVESMENELALLQKDYEIQKQSIVYENYDNTLRILEIENQIQLADNEYAEQKDAIELAREQEEQVLSNLATLKASFESKLSSMIVENLNSISNLQAEREIQTADVVEQRIIAPVSGMVKTLDIGTEGGVLNPAQQIATIVPDDGQMMAEVEVLNKDIGYLEENQETAMKLDTYNFQKYGKLNGRVVNISPDAMWDEQKGWIYLVKIAIDGDSFGYGNTDAAVGIGMEGTVEIKVADRPIIDFFLEPVVDHFDGSLKVK